MRQKVGHYCQDGEGLYKHIWLDNWRLTTLLQERKQDSIFVLRTNPLKLNLK